MIGQFSTGDVDNYGDLLYPIIFKKLTEKIGHCNPISVFGFLQGPAPCGSNYDVQDINDVLKVGKRKLTHLVVGGGDILRTDTIMMASHYRALFAKLMEQSFIYRLKKRQFGTPDLAQLFKHRFMEYGAVGPFLLDKEKYSSVGSLLYFSCGVPFELRDSEKSSVRKAIESAAYVYVRDEQSRKKLADTGVLKDIDVAPDAIVCLSDFFGKQEEKRKGKSILAKHGVEVGRRIICLQSYPQSMDVEDELLAALFEVRRICDVEIVLMPIGFCHNDDIFLQRLADRSSGICKYIEINSIFDMISVIAASDAFIGTSLHGNITAFSFGIPHLFGPVPEAKAEGFLQIVGLGSDFKIASWRDVPGKLKMLGTLPEGHIKSQAEKAKIRFYNTFSKIHAILSEPRCEQP
jgi:hypothetical protein